MEVAIIGAGMAAIGANHRLREHGIKAILYDQATQPGGHTTTHFYPGGWAFDEGPHVSFTKDNRVRELLAEAVQGEFQSLAANVDNYWRGYRFKHPAICNLYGLPPDLVVECVRDFISATQASHPTITNYEQWLIASYGKTFAETFPMEYAKKVHTTAAYNLGIDWLGPRLYQADLNEVLRGAVAADTKNVHYVTEYRYPTHGGYFSYLKPFLSKADLRSNHRVVEVSPKEQLLRFSNGTEAKYSHLICSAPLPEFVKLISGVESEVLDAASVLAWTSMVLVNVGIDRADVGDTWTYFYDEDVLFTRVSYPGQFSPNMVPAGHGSFQAEIYFSEKYKPLTRGAETFVDEAIADLRRTDLVRDSDKIRHKSAIFVPYGNIIHDHEKSGALALIHGYLDEIGVKMCGRYGLWGYQWTDEAFISGENAAQTIIDST